MTLETFNIDPAEVLTSWEVDEMAERIYASAVARCAPALGADAMAADRQFLLTLRSMARFAAAVYFEAEDGNEET